MSSTLRLTIWFLLVSLTANPCLAQDPRLDVAVEKGFFGLGWSKDGRRFAFGWFETTMHISNGSRISVVAQDIVTDKILWKESKEWDEGNAGGPGGYYPSTAPKAWRHIADVGTRELGRQSISGPAPTVSTFPLAIGEQTVKVEIRDNPDDDVFEVWAISSTRGEKRISRVERSYFGSESALRVVGYALNPDRSRMAVVLNQSFFTSYTTYEVVGCHLRAGFKKAANEKSPP